MTDKIAQLEANLEEQENVVENDIRRKKTKTRNTRVRHLEETQDEQKDQEKVAEHELSENNDIKTSIVTTDNH